MLAGFASACHGPHAYLNSAIRLMKIDCTATSAIVGPILTLTHWALLLPDFGGAYRRSVGKMNSI